MKHIKTFDEFLNEQENTGTVKTFSSVTYYIDSIVRLCNIKDYHDGSPFDETDELLEDATVEDLYKHIECIEEYENYGLRTDDYDEYEEYFDEEGYELYPPKKGKAEKMLNGIASDEKPMFVNFGKILEKLKGFNLCVIDEILSYVTEKNEGKYKGYSNINMRIFSANSFQDVVINIVKLIAKDLDHEKFMHIFNKLTPENRSKYRNFATINKFKLH